MISMVFVVLSAFTHIGGSNAQTALPDSTNTLEGLWLSDNIELYQYTGNDSTKVSLDALPVNNVVSGAFDTLHFSGEKCRINVSWVKEVAFRKDGSQLEFFIEPLSHAYTIVACEKKRLVLYRKYSIYDRKNREMLYYGVSLKYIQK
jgi:hypothetical protein